MHSPTNRPHDERTQFFVDSHATHTTPRNSGPHGDERHERHGEPQHERRRARLDPVDRGTAGARPAAAARGGHLRAGPAGDDGREQQRGRIVAVERHHQRGDHVAGDRRSGARRRGAVRRRHVVRRRHPADRRRVKFSIYRITVFLSRLFKCFLNRSQTKYLLFPLRIFKLNIELYRAHASRFTEGVFRESFFRDLIINYSTMYDYFSQSRSLLSVSKHTE